MSVPIPNDTFFIDFEFYDQFLVIDPAANPLGIVTTNAARGKMGNP